MSFLNFFFDDTLEILRHSIRDFAKKEIQPLAAQLDKENIFPNELWPKLGHLGFLGITAEERYGGSALGYLAHVIVMEEISRACAAIGLSYGAHSNLCLNQIQLNGNNAQKEKYLPKLCSGEFIGALAISEPGAGSDVMSMRLNAKKIKNYYLLNGTKMWITNGPDANILVVYAKMDEPLHPRQTITAFLIEKDFPGFHSAQKLDKLGMRGSNTSELVFENCKVPEENVLGVPGKGIEVLMKGLDYERVILAAGPIGIMQSCMDLVLPYVHERKQFNRPIGEFELIQAKLADMYTALMTSRSYLYSVARACDNKSLARKDAASVILYAAEKATWMASQTIQCLGGNGYINEYPAGRLWRDAKLYEIGAGTSEIRRMLIGRELFDEYIS